MYISAGLLIFGVAFVVWATLEISQSQTPRPEDPPMDEWELKREAEMRRSHLERERRLRERATEEEDAVARAWIEMGILERIVWNAKHGVPNKAAIIRVHKQLDREKRERANK